MIAGTSTVVPRISPFGFSVSQLLAINSYGPRIRRAGGYGLLTDLVTHNHHLLVSHPDGEQWHTRYAVERPQGSLHIWRDQALTNPSGPFSTLSQSRYRRLFFQRCITPTEFRCGRVKENP